MEGFDVVDPHNPSDTILTTGLARFLQVEKTAWGPVEVVTRRIGCSD